MHVVSKLRRHVIYSLAMVMGLMSASSLTMLSFIMIRAMMLLVWTIRDSDTVRESEEELNREQTSMKMDSNLFKRSENSTKIHMVQIFHSSQLATVREVHWLWELQDFKKREESLNFLVKSLLYLTLVFRLTTGLRSIGRNLLKKKRILMKLAFFQRKHSETGPS